MTDKPKTIQEALAEIQRNIEIEELKQTPTTGSVKSGFSKLTPGAKSRAVGVATTAARNIGAPAIGAGAGFLAGKAAEKLATGTETGRNLGKLIGDNVPGAKTAADALKPVGDEIRRTFGAEVPKRASDNTDSKPAEPAKTETPPAGSSAAKMSFADAYNKARQMAKAAGKDENLAQFKFDRGGGEKIYQAAATKADYVPIKKQFAVDINAPSTTKNPPAPKEEKPQTESGKKKMSEDYMEEAPLMGSQSDFVNFKKHNQNATYGQYLNTIRGLTAKKGGANDPDVIQRKMNSAAMKSSGGPVTTGKAWNPDNIRTPSSRPPVNTTPGGGSTANINPPGRTSSTPPPVLQDRGSDPKLSSFVDSDFGIGQTTGSGGTTQSSIRAVGTRGSWRSGGGTETSKDRYHDSEAKGGNPTPSGGSGVMTSSGNPNKQAQTESGKKKMSEENNSLIDMFLRLQEKNTLSPNIFEAAKKAKKDYDGDGKVESPKDEVWGSRFKAAKAAGKMEEGAGDETAKKETSMSVTMDNKPSTPAQTNAATSGPSAADKKALDAKVKTIAKEEVTFSQAEIDHINSFFEAVAPSREEPTKSVNPTVKNTDLTDETLEEGRPKKNPQPETTERDARQHIQVIAGRAAGGNTLDFPHNDGSKSKITPAMGRRITAHLNGLKPAERQAAVNKMHASADGLKV